MQELTRIHIPVFTQQAQHNRHNTTGTTQQAQHNRHNTTGNYPINTEEEQ
jgi:hypothetical protein